MSDHIFTSSAVLDANGLTIGYGSKMIAQDINVTIQSGEMICLLGQNGVGKSTLLRTLSFLHKSLEGTVKINGTEINQIDRRELSKLVGIVTTEKVGTPHMTVRELVGMGRYPYSNWLGTLSAKDKSIVSEAITLCKIDYLADQPLRTLSDGQRQKAMIARVLAQETKLIILDEPTAHLDIVNRGEVMKLLSDIKLEKKKSILISTHELPLSLQFADQLWLMNYNSPLVTGAPEDLALAGSLSDIFYNEEFDLDVLNGRVLMRDMPQHYVSLNGEQEAVTWTQLSLKRLNIGISEEAESSVYVRLREGILLWEMEWGETSWNGEKLSSLLNHLEDHIKNQV